MTVALLLTLLAITGAALGMMLGESQMFSSYLAAAGGGLLFGISLFWLVPEIASSSGWTAAVGMTAATCVILAFADHLFIHMGHASRQVALGPILAATALHSFLDGWSVRALASLRIAGIAGPLGLALHKIPEGIAIGWIARRSLHSSWKAAFAAVSVELATVLGAYVEPHASASGFAAFGAWWTAAVIAVVSGSFLFVAVHAVLPNRRQPGIIAIFMATLLLVAAVGFVKSGNI
jgi:zinc transporter ZupT